MDDDMTFMMQEAMQSCPVRTVMGTGAGFVFGGLFSMFMQSNEYMLDDKYLRMTVKEQATVTLKEMRVKMWAGAKQFAVMSAMFSSSECVIESARGKDDVWNTVSSGCFTGAVLARNAGVQAMGVGCVGFAAFSAAIHEYMERTRHD